ncbi:MAG: hypothetical protein JWN52_2300 [Actinomycetia bacterium]|nr:hypothetical protein [Actinomycetes bacterium]
MELRQLLDAAQDRLDRWQAGDPDAVTDRAALELAAQLEALGDTEPAAVRAAGMLVWSRYLAEEDFLDVESLDQALSLFARVPQQEIPELVADIFAAEIPSDIEAARPEAPCHPSQLVTVAVHLREELADDQSLEDVILLRLAAGLTRLAFEYARSDGVIVASLLAIHADAVQRVAGANRDSELLPEVLAVRRLSLAKARPDDPNLDEIREELVWALLLVYSCEGDEALLDEIRATLDEGLPDPAGIAVLMRDYVLDTQRFEPFDYKRAAIGYAATGVYKLSGGTEPADFWNVSRSSDDDGPGVVSVPPGEVVEIPVAGQEPLRMMNLNIEEFTARQIEAELGEVPAGDPGGRAVLLVELADRYRHRFAERQSRDFLERAVSLSREAVQICPRSDPRRAVCVLAHFRNLLARHTLDGDPADLDGVIDYLREYLALGAITDPAVQARHLADLASYLLGRFEETRRRDDLDQAYEVSTRAVRIAPEGSPVAYLARAVLGLVTLNRSDAGMPDADLDSAVGLLLEGSGLPESDENHPTVLNNLSIALVSRYYAGGSVADLDEAVAAARAAWDSTPSTQWMRVHASYRALGTALGLRYRELGALSDLDDAVALSRAVLASLPAGHPFVAVARSDLAEQLAVRAQRSSSATELTEAVRLARTAVQEAGGDRYAERARWSLATVLATPAGDPVDQARVREAVAIHRALKPSRSGRIELARLLQTLFVTSAADRPAFELSREAEQLLREVRRTTTDKAELHLDLGTVLYERARRDGNELTMRESSRFFRSVALDLAAPPFQRLTAARLWGAALAGCEEWAEAVKAYRLAIDLLPQVAPRTLIRADQEHRLSRTADLVSDACVAALRTGDPVAAIQMFEAGRGVLWAQLMQAKDDLAKLSGASPELAARFARLRDELDEPYAREAMSADSAGRLAERRRRLGTEWQELIDEIRRLDGFAAFASASEAGSLHPGVEGTVVLLAPSIHGTHAILLHPGDRIDTLPLTDVTPDTAQAATDRVREALVVLQEPASGLGGRLRAEAEIQAILAWLWTAVAQPVLDRLGTSDDPLRIWWVPGGPLASLPIHAAGEAPARACSSYSTTLQALRTDRRAAVSIPPRVLVVAMPDTPGTAPLPGARAEADLLRERIVPLELIGADATRASVLAALAECEVAHFACHSALVPEHPGAARLLLHDHQTEPLTLLDVARLHLPDARLAYLSSCATLLSGRGLADEAVHLAAAFQHAGFPEVVGTLWPMDDEKAALPIARGFYARLSVSGAAEALRTATMHLASAYPRNPSFWACHVHVGAAPALEA